MLRHYDDVGLFQPSRIGDNGYRRYDESRLPRLFRITALRRAGMSLADIGGILEETSGEADGLRRHLRELSAEAERLAALIATIEAHAGSGDRAPGRKLRRTDDSPRRACGRRSLPGNA